MGVDILLTITFNSELAELSPKEYFQNILINKLNTRIVCVGYDFTFGKNRAGNVRVLLELAEQFDIDTEILEPQKIDDHVVSSTRIRELITNISDSI